MHLCSHNNNNAGTCSLALCQIANAIRLTCVCQTPLEFFFQEQSYSRFGKSTHISMISNSVTHLRSYTNSAIADIAGNSAPISPVTPCDRRRRRVTTSPHPATTSPHPATTSPHRAPISSHRMTSARSPTSLSQTQTSPHRAPMSPHQAPMSPHRAPI